MIRALLAKVIGDAKWLFVAIFVLMFFFPWVFLWASGKISLPAFSNFLASALPREWQQLWGVPFSQVATPAGRAALVFVHPLIVFSAAIWTVARGSDCVSGEIGRGTMEMLLAQPVRRTTVYATQAFVTIIGQRVARNRSLVWNGAWLARRPTLRTCVAGALHSARGQSICVNGLSGRDGGTGLLVRQRALADDRINGRLVRTFHRAGRREPDRRSVEMVG